MGVVPSVTGTSEPNYVLILTLFNASIVVYIVVKHLRNVRRKQMTEKPGAPPQ